ncbi:MAG: alpha/beta hydrolase [Vicinamibacterales bacterium]
MTRLHRRDALRHAAAVAAAAVLPVRLGAQVAPAGNAGAAPDPARFFPGFTSARVRTAGAEINLVHAGSGPPLLLLHGAPQTHISWRLAAPELAKRYTVVVPDLRGYGDSSKPADTADHAGSSKRAMALDQVEVMRHFGFERFAVVGHDRGGRVAHRLALDHPDVVTRLAVLDIVPTYYLYTHVTIEFIQAYFHWFNYVRAAPGPEEELKAQFDARAARATTDAQREYARVYADMANIHGMCEDYRASASIDLQHDAESWGRKVQCPLLTLWGLKGPMGRIYDVLAIWKDRGVSVSGRGLPAGHNLQEEAPEAVLAEVMPFLAG